VLAAGWVAGCSSGHAAVKSAAPLPTRATSTTLPITVATAPTATTTLPPTTAAPATTTTAAPTTTKAPPPNGLAGRVVVIDPGHNGANGANPAIINQLVPAGGFMKACDTTGTATDAGYSEAAYNFDVATRMVAILTAKGIKVVLTRPSNTGVGPCVNQRAAIGNAAHADAAISVHADGAPANGRGFHVIQPALVPGYTDGIVTPSHQLALAVRASFLAGTGMPYSTYIGVQGLDTRGDLGGLNLSTVPKVFIECGNMRNAADAGLFTSADFRQLAAQALAQGIEAFLTSLPPRHA
jgi:N-acetylmuramoyl-L-alanine amidase